MTQWARFSRSTSSTTSRATSTGPAATSLADTFAQLDGLRWKIWTLNEETGEAGGIFLFDDEPSRQGYLDGLYAEVIGGNPAFHDSVIKKFDVIEDATQVTHGPVGTVMADVSGPVGKVLQIHFQYDITSDEYRAAATSLADTFAQLDGLRWKIWTLNEETGEAGGIFLFDDEPSRQGYLDGLYAEVRQSGFRLVIKKFDVIETPPGTHGPVGTLVNAVLVTSISFESLSGGCHG
ncbi:MAG: YdhR family protein [Caldilineaceae bacterium]